MVAMAAVATVVTAEAAAEGTKILRSQDEWILRGTFIDYMILVCVGIVKR